MKKKIDIRPLEHMLEAIEDCIEVHAGDVVTIESIYDFLDGDYNVIAADENCPNACDDCAFGGFVHEFACCLVVKCSDDYVYLQKIGEE
jgi:hypothetical protein